MTARFSIEPLSSKHDRSGFACGSPPLDRYFTELAGQDVKRRLSNCFVLVDEDGAVVGYYTLAATSIALTDLPDDEGRRLPRYPVLPAALIGRLAVDTRFQRRGLGNILLMDAIQRSSRAEAAVFALIVDATDEAAALFYGRCGFRSFAGRPLRLYLPMATALKALGA